MNQYCADSLEMIWFVGQRGFSDENFTKPFKSVTTVAIYQVLLGKQLPNFVRWFPNLREFLTTNIDIDKTAIAVPFPHLENLKTTVYGDNNHNHSQDFTLENAVSLLHANRQLKDLIVSMFGTLVELLNAISENKALLKLTVTTNVNTNVNSIDLKRLMDEHPLIEALDFMLCFFTADAVRGSTIESFKTI